MTGNLYVIGVGPGDPELLTLKAVRILKDVRCICVPKGREEGSSLALSIVEKAMNLEDKEIIEAHFPMRKTKSSEYNKELNPKWQKTVEIVTSKLNQGIDMAFVTLGDPSIYSTFFYLYNRLIELNPDLNIEIVPGVSSISASASRAKISLGLADEKIAILPATYSDNLKEVLMKFDTTVLMKVHRVFNKVLESLEETALVDNATYVSRAGMENEYIFRNIRDVKNENLDYFSLVIIRK